MLVKKNYQQCKILHNKVGIIFVMQHVNYHGCVLILKRLHRLDVLYRQVDIPIGVVSLCHIDVMYRLMAV